jgi:Cu2+-exporting ATPase
LAAAIIDYLKGYARNGYELSEFDYLTGQGIQAMYEEDELLIGNQSLMEKKQVSMPPGLIKELEETQKEVATQVFVARNGQLELIFRVEDEIKPTSLNAIKELQESGIKVHMMTGDNQHVAADVARKTGVENYKAEVMPRDKLEYVKELQNKGHRVAMVGDGINDSPALAQADIGIAMGKGTDVAIESAQITLFRGDLEKIRSAIDLSASTLRTIKQNLFWAFFYNVIAIPIAAGILYPVNGFLLNPMIAGAAMSFSSVSVVMNSLRLKSKTLK